MLPLSVFASRFSLLPDIDGGRACVHGCSLRAIYMMRMRVCDMRMRTHDTCDDEKKMGEYVRLLVR